MYVCIRGVCEFVYLQRFVVVTNTMWGLLSARSSLATHPPTVREGEANNGEEPKEDRWVAKEGEGDGGGTKSKRRRNPETL